jgi:hypothetical protein
MTKSSGLGDDLFFGGYHIGGDTQTYNIASPTGVQDVTDITQSAHSRLLLLRDGSLDWVSYFDKAAGAAHAALSPQVATDQIATVLCGGHTLGGECACLNAKQLSYDPSRSATGELTIKVQAQANGFGLEWCKQLTPGLRTDTAATNGASFDQANGLSAPSVPASGTPVTNPSSVPVTVVITGGTMTNVVINGVSVGTGAGTYTLPPGAAITLTYTVAPTWTWTAVTAFGAQAYLQATALTGTTATVTIQHSPDNATWTTLLAFAAVTSAPQAQRATVSNTTTVNRYLRAITTGTFTSFAFQVGINVNLVSGQVF